MIDDINEYMLNSSMAIVLNASDFFNYACADAVTLDQWDFEWAFPFIKEWGDEGVNAVMAYVRGAEPIKPWQTPRYLEAYAALVALAPEVNS
jgi:hypothetical protein